MLKRIIKLKKVNVTYGSSRANEVKALQDANLEIYEGEYIYIFGPSGCGKSTLLNVIAGLQIPDSGKVTVAGSNLVNLNPVALAKFHCDKIGMIFQTYNLISTLSVLDNVTLPQMFLSVPPRQREEKAKKLLKRFGILEKADKFPTQLSGGQMQRVGITRALINDPQVLLADEPIGDLDSTSAKNVMGMLVQLNRKERLTLIVVTHNPENITDAHRVLYMKDGKIVKEQVNYELESTDRPLKRTPGEKKLGHAEATEYDLLVRAFSALSPAQIHQLLLPYKAKVLANYLLSPYAGETRIDRLERAIDNLLSNKSSIEKFTHTLSSPFDKGGVQFNFQRARRFSKEIEGIITIASALSKKRDKPVTKETCELITKFLLSNHGSILPDVKIKRLNLIVAERLKNKIDMKDFQKIIDRPLKEGGAGLNTQTAEKFARQLELILLVKYGF